ncbi:glycosyltransferase family 87 protein [Planosporangium sp. 12N6]|uniref:glycosyltransferase family 87 protein n=1 Tax=Planosporangium spinosum TaxID=3402278 RepID=UPI003CF2B021
MVEPLRGVTAAAARRITRATPAAGLGVDLALYGLSALFALATAVASTLAPHRAWGSIAVVGYAAATLCVLVQLRWRRSGVTGRAAVTALAWVATALVPLVVEAARGQEQEEVTVVEHAGRRLLETGTPYLDRAAIAALPVDERLLGYVPYQPGMALFGLPRAAAGEAWWTDARVWFALVTAAALGWALAVLAPRASGAALVRAAQAATVLPLCALTLAAGGDDLPVLALCLLALAFAAVDRPLAAGVAVGLAGALKLFAWPVALVLLAFTATRGRRAVTRCAVGALGLPVAAVLPALAVAPGAAVENLVRFPLGRGLVGSPAASPFPGHLIAAALPAGRAVATALLVVAGLVIGWWLLRRPPRDAGSAATISAYGLTAAIALMPATRFGYLLYPVAYLVWVPALRPARAAGAADSPPVLARRTQGE